MLKSTYKAPAGKSAVTPLPEGWTEHTSPTGHKYYYNSSTKQSTYTRPALEANEPLQIDFNATEPDHEVRASLIAQDEFQKNTVVDPRAQTQFPDGHGHQHQPRRRGHGGDRPKSKAPIPECAPWYLVKTKFGRRFVHNAETKQSLWKFPQDVMMAVIEMDRLEWEAKKQKDEKQSKTETEEQRDRTETAEEPNTKEKLGLRRQDDPGEDDSDSYEEVEVTDDEGEEETDPSSKRPKLASQEPAAAPGPVEYEEDDIEWQLAQVDKYGDEHDDAAEEEDEGLPMTEEDNIALFRSLLDDFHISPYATFEKIVEDNTLIEDDRYTVLPNMHRRREVFSDWSRDRVAEQQETKLRQKSKKNDPRVDYLQFLHKTASPKLYWPEYKRKYKTAPEMKDYDFSDKEREKLYREYVQKVKAGESERRKDLLGLLKSLPREQLTRSSSIQDLPDIVIRDVRYYLVDEKKRGELVEGFISTLPDD